MSLAQNRSVERQHLFSATAVAHGRSVSLSLSAEEHDGWIGRRNLFVSKLRISFCRKETVFRSGERERERERSQQRGSGRGRGRERAFTAKRRKAEGYQEAVDIMRNNFEQRSLRPTRKF